MPPSVDQLRDWVSRPPPSGVRVVRYGSIYQFDAADRGRDLSVHLTIYATPVPPCDGTYSILLPYRLYPLTIHISFIRPQFSSIMSQIIQATVAVNRITTFLGSDELQATARQFLAIEGGPKEGNTVRNSVHPVFTRVT